jgi:hypothetical protein
MTLIFTWTYWEFWVLAILLLANLGRRSPSFDCGEILARLDEIQESLEPERAESEDA